jgi:recombinational DNA repair ATPase RecF
VSPKYSDAMGYLEELKNDVGQPWFTMICDLVRHRHITQLDKRLLEGALAVLVGRACPVPISPPASTTIPPPAATAAAHWLTKVGGFKNFKLLQETLLVTFDKRITLIFGTNGSGKSSLCEALKLLADDGEPQRPLANKRIPQSSPTEFRFHFQADAAESRWTKAAGYGSKREAIRYFDTSIALGNLKNPMEPSRVVQLAPFKLHVFNSARALTESVRDASQTKVREAENVLESTIEEVRKRFEAFPGKSLAQLTADGVAGIAAAITTARAGVNPEQLKEKKQAVTELEKSTSKEGLQLLEAEHNELKSLIESVESVTEAAAMLAELEPWEVQKQIDAKTAERDTLVKALCHDEDGIKAFLQMLEGAAGVCDLEDPKDAQCPLCKQKMGESERELFKRYSEFLANKLSEQITELQKQMTKAKGYIKTLDGIDTTEWTTVAALDKELPTKAVAFTTTVLREYVLAAPPTSTGQDSRVSLLTLFTEWSALLATKRGAIDAARTNLASAKEELEKLKNEVADLEYFQATIENVAMLEKVQAEHEEAQLWQSVQGEFTGILRKITDKAKASYEELVVSDFETRLNHEYEALTEQKMADFGVELARRGSEANVTYLPRIGGSDIGGILSEGEQRVHALALFFAEVDSSNHTTIIFDDPISSFDYNYIHNYCIRLRDLAIKYPTRQLIVCTHCWEFFVQLQTTLNKARLDGHLSVQVVESCSYTSEYSEKVDELKTGIESILALPTEPTTEQKEKLAGYMRRLMEAVVNTHVFNKQRHQYKQKSLQITAFDEFTKVTPLEKQEAVDLKELYEKLSITEHDDPRNAFVNSNKAMLQTRYDKIKKIEAAIIARKPA